MYRSHSILYLGMLIMAVAGNQVLEDCLNSKKEYTMNVVLLEDTLTGVKGAVEEAIKEDNLLNIEQGMDCS